MAANEKSFKTISPGVQIRILDNSGVPANLEEIGPVVIGRAQRGPANRPVRVSSYSEFVDYFGESTQGTDLVDVWRDNVVVGPSYGALAAQASLANKNALTFIRLLGTQHPDAVAAGYAGWSAGSISNVGTGGAYGLFLFPSSSGNGAAAYPNQVVATGTLAAIWYLTSGTLALSGNFYEEPAGGPATTGTAGLILSDADKRFCVMIKNSSGVTTEKVTFDFTPSSDRFIRKVFNTNPTVTNSSLFATTKNYFLGETFEDFINNSEEMTAVRSATKLVGVVMALKNNDTSDELSSRKIPAQHARTGWFFAQDFGTPTQFEVDGAQKLFKIHAFDSGEWAQGHIKVSLRNIRVSQNEIDRYGTFDVLVRKIDDSDSNLVIYEQFNGCNLNPASNDYIAKKIGDKYTTYSTTELRNIEIGQFDNQSKYIRVEMDSSVDQGVVTPEALPFGVYGPVKFRNLSFSSASVGLVGSRFGQPTNPESAFTAAFLLASSSIAESMLVGPGTRKDNASVNFGSGSFATIKTASVIFPYPRLRGSSLSGTLRQSSDAFWGVYTDDVSSKFAASIKDVVRCLPLGVDSFIPSTAEGTDYAWKFSLDDLVYAGSSSDANYTSGSRQAGTSISAVTSYNTVLTGGWNAFTTLLAGGFDGFDIKEIEPLNNTDMAGATAKTSYAYNTIQRAIQLLQFKEDTDFNVAAVPGVNVPGLTRQLIEVCAERGDALAVIDLENDYVPSSENSSAFSSRLPNVSSAIASLKTRALNTNYAAAYFPWVQGRDPITNNIMWMPPSVVALGAYAYNDRVGAPHQAPAGFNRAALSEGHAGIPVINVSYKLLEKDRDRLYQANINPIAVLEKTVVIMGQKTLQIKASALDRINVQRGILDIRKKFSKIATKLVFEPNDSDTWRRFKNQAEPILDDIVAKLGLEDYLLVMDSRTNTPDLRDRNIIYGKVFLKPTKTAEFFQLEFNITNSGAAFAE